MREHKNQNFDTCMTLMLTFIKWSSAT